MSKANANSGDYFVVEFPLKVNRRDKARLEQRYKVACQYYNGLVDITQKKYNQMINGKNYKSLSSELDSKLKDKKLIASRMKGLSESSLTYKNLNKSLKVVEKDIKAINSKLSDIRKYFGFTEDGFRVLVTEESLKFFTKNLDTRTARFLAENLFKSYETYMFQGGKKIHKKKLNELNTIGNRDVKQSLRVKGECNSKSDYNVYVVWGSGRKDSVKPLKLPIIIEKNNDYEFNSLFVNKNGVYELNTIKVVSLVRKFIRGKYKYYVQITFQGKSPKKLIKKSSKNIKNVNSQVGIDIGVSTVAVVGDNNISYEKLAIDGQEQIVNEIKVLSQKMDRSRRMLNPQNYNVDGTIKEIVGEKRKWNYSKNYIRYRKKFNNLNRKLSEKRKQYFLTLLKSYLNYGDIFIVEDMNFKALHKRSNKGKKRFGRSINYNAPGLFIRLLKQEASYFGKTVIEVSPKKYKASQHNWTNGSYEKHSLSDRTLELEPGLFVNRDCSAAFNLQNVDLVTESYDYSLFNLKKSNFMKLHDDLFVLLKENKDNGIVYPSCMGIK